MHILNLRMCISSLRMYIPNLKMNFPPGQNGFVSPLPRSFLPLARENFPAWAERRGGQPVLPHERALAWDKMEKMPDEATSRTFLAAAFSPSRPLPVRDKL